MHVYCVYTCMYVYIYIYIYIWHDINHAAGTSHLAAFRIEVQESGNSLRNSSSQNLFVRNCEIWCDLLQEPTHSRMATFWDLIRRTAKTTLLRILDNS